MGKVRFSIQRKHPGPHHPRGHEIRRGGEPRCSYRTQAKALSRVNSSCNEESRSHLLVAGKYVHYLRVRLLLLLVLELYLSNSERNSPAQTVTGGHTISKDVALNLADRSNAKSFRDGRSDQHRARRPINTGHAARRAH